MRCREERFTITDPLGIHIRPSLDILEVARKYTGAVILEYEGKSYDAKIYENLLKTCNHPSRDITVRVEEGEGCEATMHEFRTLKFWKSAELAPQFA